MNAQTGTGRLQLATISVAEAMHPGVLTCPVETPLRSVARMLAKYNVHCVVVFGSNVEHEEGEVEPWGVVSDLDAVAALLADGENRTAGGAAASPLVLVGGDDSLEHAARLMVENETSHLLVVDQGTMRPVGILSTLDVAAALAEVPVHSGPPRVERA